MTIAPIGVGIIGVGGWASYGHLPALASLDNVQVVAVSSRSLAKAQALAAEHGIPHAFDDYRELVNDPDVDLVVIPTPAPEHAVLVKAAIAAGKDVYSEWPLTTNTAESEELLALAEAAGVRHVVGLQRRFSPSARYAIDLIAQGHVGEIRGVTMSVGVDAFGPELPSRHAWVLDPAAFVSLLPVYFGHFADLLFATVGPPSTLTAVSENQFPIVTLTDTGEQVPYPVPTEVMMVGNLQRGGLFSIQLEGGQGHHKTGLRIVITGTEGALRISNPRAFENEQENAIEEMTGDATSCSPLAIPERYVLLRDDDLDQSVRDVAYLYNAYAQDVRNGGSTVSDFTDAVNLHRLIDQVTRSSAGSSQAAQNNVRWG
ncbi:MAG: Gfo/Idh/MocA family oxidoreductase [Propionibacteriaceae bacterium]|nr:Gfo/Idh/MocA family oxidoreductase [Micropruina sp.]HBX82370.1 gfo/Idh/MocA family oxidoreductase [Propionibacteriaceae bacterium]HBY22546.1 gfo/Idh/MocA family oxidoreductase [Propionibacteriaceae bacterium]